jgi:hypothetical protein
MVRFFIAWMVFVLSCTSSAIAAECTRVMRFRAETSAQAAVWQHAARDKLFSMMMAGAQPARHPLEVKVLQRIEQPGAGYVLEEVTLRSLPDRRVHAWLGQPSHKNGKVGGVLALHGHVIRGEDVIRGERLYWHGRTLLEMGYEVIAPDVGQHELQHSTWSLMGERTWDVLRCLDYLAALPDVDENRLAVAGLSLGGETAMYVAALDKRVKLACCSGWLSTVANLEKGHCACYRFPGLVENFDFADIFACVAPRSLVCELGDEERGPGEFPVAIGRNAMEEIRIAYKVFNAPSSAVLRMTQTERISLTTLAGRPSVRRCSRPLA